MESELRTQVRDIANEIKALPPSLPAKNFKKKLVDIAERDFDWDENHDRQVARGLRKLAHDISRTAHLKEHGVDGLPDKLKPKVGELVTTLQGRGLFLVPVGELERWLSSAKITVSTKK